MLFGSGFRSRQLRLAALRRALSTIAAGSLTLSLLGVSVATAPVALASNQCNGFSSATWLGNSYHDDDVTVAACGPRPAYGGPRTAVYAYPGALYNPGYQCVELIARYLYMKFGATMGISTNGDQAVDHYAAKYPNLFSVVKNGTFGQPPVQGDVISFSASSSFNSSAGGHTAIVQSSSIDPTGDGTVLVVEQNWSSNGLRTLTMNNWKLSLVGFAYIKWMHPKSANSGPLAATAISVTSAPGFFTNLPIRTSFSVKNQSTSSVSVRSLNFLVRDPSGNSSTLTCASSVSLAPGDFVTCQSTKKWTAAGTYRLWPTWQDAKGNWYTGQIGSVATVTLAPGSVPSAPSYSSLQVTDAGLEVDWSSPMSSGGPAVSGYVVTTNPASQTLTVPASTTKALLTQLDSNVTYTVNVQAVNAIGKSTPLGAVSEGSILQVTPSTTNTLYDKPVTVAGTLTSASGAPRAGSLVTLYGRTIGGSWTQITQLTTDENGAFTYDSAQPVSTQYYATFDGTQNLRSTQSATVTVLASPVLTLSTSTTKVRKNWRVYISGTFAPAGTPQHVELQVWTGKTWRPLERVWTGTNGYFRTSWIPKTAGTFTIRAVSGSTASYASVMSNSRPLTVVSTTR